MTGRNRFTVHKRVAGLRLSQLLRDQEVMTGSGITMTGPVAMRPAAVPRRTVRVVSGIHAFYIAGLAVFAGVLKWI